MKILVHFRDLYTLEKGFEASERGDYATALKNWQPLAQHGDPKAQFNLGLMYEKGQGVPQNYSEATYWYRRSAEQGDPGAQYNLSIMYQHNRGVARNPVMSHVLEILAISQGLTEAKINYDASLGSLSYMQIAEARRMANQWRVGTPLPYYDDFTTWP